MYLPNFKIKFFFTINYSKKSDYNKYFTKKNLYINFQFCKLV